MLLSQFRPWIKLIYIIGIFILFVDCRALRFYCADHGIDEYGIEMLDRKQLTDCIKEVLRLGKQVFSPSHVLIVCACREANVFLSLLMQCMRIFTCEVEYSSATIHDVPTKLHHHITLAELLWPSKNG